MVGAPRPKQSIRRFDVFAEYTRIQEEQEGRSPREAKGYGLWLAKVVAGRRFGARAERRAPPEEAHRPPSPREGEAPFRSVGGVPQTDVMFDREIVARMGEDFYREVFAPAVAHAFQEGKAYETIRDTVRKDWKPERRRQAGR